MYESGFHINSIQTFFSFIQNCFAASNINVDLLTYDIYILTLLCDLIQKTIFTMFNFNDFKEESFIVILKK